MYPVPWHVNVQLKILGGRTCVYHAKSAEVVGARGDFFESLEAGDAGTASLRWPLATQLSTKVGKNQNKLLADKDRIEDYEYEKAYIFADFGFYGGNLGLFQESQAGADRYCA